STSSTVTSAVTEKVLSVRRYAPISLRASMASAWITGAGAASVAEAAPGAGVVGVDGAGGCAWQVPAARSAAARVTFTTLRIVSIDNLPFRYRPLRGVRPSGGCKAHISRSPV